MIFFFKRILLKLVFGKSYNYMVKTLLLDNRAKKAKLIDIIVYKDGIEKRIEGDWLKTMAQIVSTFKSEKEAIEYDLELEMLFGKHKPGMIHRQLLCDSCKIIKDILE